MINLRFTIRSLFLVTALVCCYGAGWISTAWMRDKEINNYRGRYVHLKGEIRRLEERVKEQKLEIDTLRLRLKAVSDTGDPRTRGVISY